MTIVAAEVIEGDYLLLNFTGVLLLQGGDTPINYQAHCDNQTVRHNTINTINAQQILFRSDRV